MSKIFIIAALVALAAAKPAQQGVSLSQDTLGNYNLKFVTDEISRSEEGSQDGKVVGSYSYHDKDGVLHKITYVAAPNAGFVAQGDVPTQVQETPEVAAARKYHLAIVEKERAILPPLKEDFEGRHEVVFAPAIPAIQHHHVQTAPVVHHRVVVDNIAELEAAKAEHFDAHKKALEHLAQEYRKLAKF